jgi:large subunit ribosomal protein L25
VDWVTRELEVECLPADIPEKISVDISNLEIGKHLRVADLTPPAKVTILTEPDVVIAHVVAPRAEEEVAPAAEAAPAAEGAVAEPEVIKKGKAVAEGETAEEPKAAEKPEKKAEKKEKK